MSRSAKPSTRVGSSFGRSHSHVDPLQVSRTVRTTHSVDLTLAPDISVPIAGAFVYDPTLANLAETIARNSKRIQLAQSPYLLERNIFILGMTRETIELPIKNGEPC